MALAAMCAAALLIVACLAGCSGSESGAAALSDAAKAEEAHYGVSIAGAEVVVDSQGGEALVVAFDYANNTQTAVSFMQAVPTAAAQDGIAMGQNAFVTDYTGSDGVTPDYMLKVEPGASTTVHMAFALESHGDVTVRCTEGFVDGGYPNMGLVLAEETFQLS